MFSFYGVCTVHVCGFTYVRMHNSVCCVCAYVFGVYLCM